MGKVVWKFQFSIDDRVRIEMPLGAQALSVQLQNGTPCLWALVDPSAPVMPYTFRLCGTGHQLPENIGRFIGTFQAHGGALVFHLFEVDPRSAEART